MAEQAQQTVTVDNVSYPISDFSQEVQSLIAVYQKWEVKAQEDRLEADRSAAACRELNRELVNRIKAALDAKAEVPAETPAE